MKLWGNNFKLKRLRLWWLGKHYLGINFYRVAVYKKNAILVELPSKVMEYKRNERGSPQCI